MGDKSLFWADQIAKRILERKRFRYTGRNVPEFKEYVVKTSASLSGVLHIGRLSDTVRGESVHRALLDSGVDSRLIWVAEDMDPLRKVPKGVPSDFSKYIGMPVTDVPDPFGCHKSYAEHYVSEYFKVIDEFVAEKMERYSMREEYRKGNFSPFVKKILERMEKVIEIQNKFRNNPLPPGWSPWKPICENCGKIITTRVNEFRDGIAHYECRDYSFENSIAKGCGHKGENDPSKSEGKLMWKSEWAAQWARWKVVSEGAGKEYQVPMSAWWVNAEIVEKVLDFPMPEPIFYEHIMIDGEKMSASKGNVVYPAGWLEVATPELLRFFYNKKLMKTRSFSWKDLPSLFDDYDRHERVFFGKEKLENEKEEEHMKRLYEISQTEKPFFAPQISFDLAVMVSQIVPVKDYMGPSLGLLKKNGHLPGNVSGKELERVKRRLSLAKEWAVKYSPERMRFEVREKVDEKIRERLSEKQKKAIRLLSGELKKKERKEEELKELFFRISKEDVGIEPRDFFRAVYLSLIGKESGPRLTRFVSALGCKRVSEILSDL